MKKAIALFVVFLLFCTSSVFSQNIINSKIVKCTYAKIGPNDVTDDVSVSLLNYYDDGGLSVILQFFTEFFAREESINMTNKKPDSPTLIWYDANYKTTNGVFIGNIKASADSSQKGKTIVSAYTKDTSKLFITIILETD